MTSLDSASIEFATACPGWGRGEQFASITGQMRTVATKRAAPRWQFINAGTGMDGNSLLVGALLMEASVLGFLCWDGEHNPPGPGTRCRDQEELTCLKMRRKSSRQ